MFGKTKAVSLTWLAVVCVIGGSLVACSQAENAQQESAEEAVSTQTQEGMTAEQEKAALHKADPVGIYGTAPHGDAVPVSDLVAAAASYEGKRVSVSGQVTEVCPMRGCWLDLSQGEETIRVKVTDGEIVFPLSAAGHDATVEGVLQRIDMTVDEARAYLAHLAEEKGEPFDPQSVTEPMVLWQVQGEGARIAS